MCSITALASEAKKYSTGVLPPNLNSPEPAEAVIAVPGDMRPLMFVVPFGKSPPEWPLGEGISFLFTPDDEVRSEKTSFFGPLHVVKH